MRTNLPKLIALTFLIASSPSAPGQESRTWTDLKGRKLEGTFVKQDATNVWVRRGDGKELQIAKKTLSEDDLKHLEEAAPATSPGAGKGGRFNSVTIDPAAWKPRPGGFKLESLVYPNNLETEHFIIGASPKTRPAVLLAYAEAAERVWADIASDLPQIVEAFDGRRLPVLLVEGEPEAKHVATWNLKHAEASRTVSPNFNLGSFIIAGFSLDEKFAEEAGLTTSGRMFRLDSKTAEHTRQTWPQRVHFFTEDILRQMIGSAKNNGDYSLSMVRMSLCYHREELICGKIESEVSFGGGSEVEGFKNGRNWAGATKKLLKAGARPDIGSFLESSALEAQPRDLGFGFGLMRFIHADPARLAGFGKLLATAGEEKESPDPQAFAKGLGFETPEALDAAWMEYMLSDAFE
jgi:hypothetical protein